MFTVKKVSEDLGITSQAIYNQKEDLQAKGYMSKNNFNEWEITTDGYNYLKDRQTNRMKHKSNVLNDGGSESFENSNKAEDKVLNQTLINFYENRIEELKKSYENQLLQQKAQVDYFRNLYEEEKSERKKINAQYQTYLLGTADDNQKWWQFWKR